MLRTVRTVIVDEIHAVIGTRRGAHLALSLERLAAGRRRTPLLRHRPVGDAEADRRGRALSSSAPTATARPRLHDRRRRPPPRDRSRARAARLAARSGDVARGLGGVLRPARRAHSRAPDDAVFVNTRRLAERVARHLSERLGEDAVTAHHGSLSKERRLDAETRLKTGALKALVATASLELGIDIGHVDLVCQIGSPHRIATLLQRVGRSGHTIAGHAEGPAVSRCRATTWSSAPRCCARSAAASSIASSRTTRRSTCWRSRSSPRPRAASTREDELFALVAARVAVSRSRRAPTSTPSSRCWPTASRRGAAAARALSTATRCNRRLRGRRGARLLALTSGGAIPEVADYRVVLEPDDTFIGTLNEDFAIESTAGDVFQLGNASWRDPAGRRRAPSASPTRKGAPPTIPFWLGEAPARSDELSRGGQRPARASIDATGSAPPDADVAEPPIVEWLAAETGARRGRGRTGRRLPRRGAPRRSA